jgi:hypothetical protein
MPQPSVRECPKCHQLTYVYEPAGYTGTDAAGRSVFYPASWGCSNCDHVETVEPRDNTEEAPHAH